MSLMRTPPLALYVHLPWCVRKCPYCDFNSHALMGSLPEAAYLRSLARDLEGELDAAGGRAVETVFFGGGTPSLFGADGLARLLDSLAAGDRLAPGAEITLEANPGTVERGSFSAFAAAGINRVSLGAQSFDAGSLRALGRIHGPAEILQAVESLRAAGLDNFNLDLMYGLPGQRPEQAVADLDAALDCGPAHLSWYQLTIEPNTVFAHGPPALPCEDAVWEMQRLAEERLVAAGFDQYEVSAWARPGRECRHNLNYWRFGDYLGIGAGAHGKLSDAAGGRILRRWKRRYPLEYMKPDRDPVAGSAEPGPAERTFEFMLNALRLRAGFEPALYEQRTGLPFAGLAPRLALMGARGLIERETGRVRASALGWQFLNDLQAAFLPEAGGERLPAG